MQVYALPRPPEIPRWVWYVIVALVALAIGLLIDEVAGLVVGLIGGAAAVRDTGNRSDGVDDELGDAYRPNIPDQPDTTIEEIEDEVHDDWTTEVDDGAPVGPGGSHTVADDVEWADDARE